MIFKYCNVKSLGCFKSKKKCLLINVISYFKKGKGFIFYKNFIDKKIINFIKFSIYYFNINFYLYNLFIIIKPSYLKKFDECLTLAIFTAIFLSFFKLNLNKKILILGGINFYNGKIFNFENYYFKINLLKKYFNILITSTDFK